MSQSLSNPAKPDRFFSKLRSFATAVYEPKLHIAFALLWAISLQGNFFAISDRQLSWMSLIDGIVTGFCFFLILFFLRIIDEIKDYEYDKQFKPDRPLVVGTVSFIDAKRFAVLVAACVIIINSVIDWRLALLALVNMLYGVFLLYLERWSPLVKNSSVVNLIVTFPVSAFLNVYALFLFIWQDQLTYTSSMNWLIFAYICAFLHFDVGRKTIWPHLTESGEQVYSQEIGGIGSAVLALILALAACGVPWWLFHPWQNNGLPAVIGWSLLMPLVISIAGSIKFISTRDRRYNPRLFYVTFLILYYLTQLASSQIG
ncbi:MAG: hypothetical protein KME17_02985 [Cyanosarcina radialis HA8281-LM2]|jgi:hypothetical protein|nr:hypothetical protein [Cyanosarcina radialis HA8281-LM2]